MADPEQTYQEVLQEEQQKGSHASVAEARAKAARTRAEHGSPHPKEPRWWPGAQPQFEGDGAVAVADEPAAAEAPEPTPAEAPVAAEVPAAAPAVAESAPQPAQAPAEQAVPTRGETLAGAAASAQPAVETVPPAPDAAAPAAQPAATAAAPIAATPTQLPPEQRPAGVTHGTTTGTRLRPEDEVTTDAQFEGQRAMYDRRKLIDELVSTGVPAVTAAETGRARSPMFAVLYIVITLLAIAAAAGAAGGEGGGETPPSPGPETGITLSAEGVAFNTNQFTLPADGATVHFENGDTVPHNIAIYQDDSTNQELFKGEVIDGGESIDYEIGALDPGEYYFQCDVHPAMNGTVTVEAAGAPAEEGGAEEGTAEEGATEE